MSKELPIVEIDLTPEYKSNVFKVRVKNSNIQKGKSAGYRIIYQVESPTSVLLLTIYSKSYLEDITPQEIKNILAESNQNE
ncbi:hypothetical protein H6F47_24145 [Sphaerospermopsis sp. FACHB-1094]|uniref:hypothetical protein n=1 Tax=Sphaerospermopsis sp. FACHB-1094 TaxID=2692861 RepID=UPI001683AB9B|nr:hypothetical protein [Sphaerospermopsis sp. FACHB-1094]MBD2135427.1 hypothetical protein [Sphaerospermopsis sp. FACHB-1094]